MASYEPEPQFIFGMRDGALVFTLGDMECTHCDETGKHASQIVCPHCQVTKGPCLVCNNRRWLNDEAHYVTCSHCAGSHYRNTNLHDFVPRDFWGYVDFEVYRFPYVFPATMTSGLNIGVVCSWAEQTKGLGDQDAINKFVTAVQTQYRRVSAVVGIGVYRADKILIQIYFDKVICKAVPTVPVVGTK